MQKHTLVITIFVLRTIQRNPRLVVIATSSNCRNLLRAFSTSFRVKARDEPLGNQVKLYLDLSEYKGMVKI